MNEALNVANRHATKNGEGGQWEWGVDLGERKGGCLLNREG